MSTFPINQTVLSKKYRTLKIHQEQFIKKTIIYTSLFVNSFIHSFLNSFHVNSSATFSPYVKNSEKTFPIRDKFTLGRFRPQTRASSNPAQPPSRRARIQSSSSLSRRVAPPPRRAHLPSPRPARSARKSAAAIRGEEGGGGGGRAEPRESSRN